MGGGQLPKVPDWRFYKVENYPDQVAVNAKLEAHGLPKDPWARNESWKYDERYFKSSWSWKLRSYYKGAKIGAALTVAVIAAETYLGATVLNNGDGGHGHH